MARDGLADRKVNKDGTQSTNSKLTWVAQKRLCRFGASYIDPALGQAIAAEIHGSDMNLYFGYYSD